MVQGEYEEHTGAGDELDLAASHSLPWLESYEEDEDAGGIDVMQVFGFAALLIALLVAVVAGVWIFASGMTGEERVADGSVIEAPEGPVKQRPDKPGGKEFAGTGNVAPLVGEGASKPGVVAEPPPGLATPMPVPSVSATPSPSPAAPPAPGTGVQLAAYGTRARAEQGWVDVTRRTEALAGVKYRIVEGKVDIGTVYRLQAVTGSRAEAERLCAALKADGIDCQVK